jgi:hypothetical protein
MMKLLRLILFSNAKFAVKFYIYNLAVVAVLFKALGNVLLAVNLKNKKGAKKKCLY